jgi:hypothetical protein
VKRLIAALLVLLCAYAHAENFGQYIGRVVVTWNDDGRSMTLIEPFAYVDPSGTKWEAPAGTKIDGASIPQFAWSIIGGPFEGKYRAPSVVHDVACNEKRHEWQDVHLMFHRGMLAAGVDPRIALIMYAAVYHFGPRWPRQVVEAIRAQTNDEVATFAHNVAGRNRKNERRGEVIKTLATRGAAGTKLVVVEFQPQPPGLTYADFQALRSAIERQNLTTDDVENFQGRARR